MTTRAEEIAAEGPYRIEWSGENRTARVIGPDFMGQWQIELVAIHRCVDLNAAFAEGYKQGQQDRWTSVEEALKSRGLHWFPEGSLLAWRRKRKPYHNYEHGIYRENENKARDHVVACGAARSVRNIYEADRAKTQEVVQETVNALHGLCHGPMSMEDAADAALAALALAKSQLNIEPTKP